MGMPFNADEVFEMAEQIERNGAKFYRAAAKNLSGVRDVLLDLAAMEDDHEKTFAAMRAELPAGRSTRGGPVFDPDEQVQMYLRVMADGHVFDVKADPVEQLAGKDTAEDVLKMAIGLEKDSIAFYVGLKEAVSRRAGKDKIEAIIKQEFGHIATLNEKLTALK
jgi:rubrerythrin